MVWRDMYQDYMFKDGEEEHLKKWREGWGEQQDCTWGAENWNIIKEMQFETREEVDAYVVRTYDRTEYQIVHV